MAEENAAMTANEKRGIFDLRLLIVAVAIIILATGIALAVVKIVVSPMLNSEMEQKVSKEMGPVFALEEFSVNLADSGGRRFIKTTMILALSNNKMQKELDEKVPLVRDKIIMILGEKTISDLESTAGKEQLKQEIITSINPLLATGEIKEVYFSSFMFN